MAIVIKDNIMGRSESHAIAMPDSVTDALIEGNKFDEIGGSHVYIYSPKQKLFESGLKNDIPDEFLKELLAALHSNYAASLEEKTKIADKMGLHQWIETGSNLTNIVMAMVDFLSKNT